MRSVEITLIQSILFFQEDADAFDKGITFLQLFSCKNHNSTFSNSVSTDHMNSGLSQTTLLKCVSERIIGGENSNNIQNSLNFMKSYTVDQQWALCRKRIFEMKSHIEEIIKNENWPCCFGNNDNAHQMFFNEYKPLFGSDRIAIAIAPDTYSYIYMETALLRTDTRDFLDKYGYQNQNTKEWKTLEELVNELRRLVEIYNKS